MFVYVSVTSELYSNMWDIEYETLEFMWIQIFEIAYTKCPVSNLSFWKV